MALDFSSCTFLGPALPAPFVKLDLEGELRKAELLPKTTGAEGRELEEGWDAYRRKLRELVARGGSVRVFNHVIEPLVRQLGYDALEPSDPVSTRLEPKEGENGGSILRTADGKPKLRAWATSFEEDLDAPAQRGAAYRYSHLRIAQRVLLASNERVGLLTNGVQVRILISDPARPDSEVIIPIDPDWRRSRSVPDSFLLLLALCRPEGVKAIPDLVDKARLKQATVTKELRVQARQAVELFVQQVLDDPQNQAALASIENKQQLARQLWHEGLVTIYRLLFILKGEASDDPARSFSFASTSLWRNTYSPSVALARYARAVLDGGAETGGLLEGGLRALVRMFEQGLSCTELHIAPLGGALFGEHAAPLLTRLHWGERACACLLDRLLWTPKRRGAETRERVHYGPLDVEDLGRVYEALLELEPGIAAEPMCRLRRAKLEVVAPIAQGEKYRPAEQPLPDGLADAIEDEPDQSDLSDESNDDETPQRGKKTKVEWVEAIRPGQFYLRVGLGRKASGSYYTPHSFVRFLVQETLGPQVAERSPQDDPKPSEILKLKVLDPAMGSGHFLVEACRFLGEHLYEACRLCDERATAAERKAESAADKEDERAFEAAAREAQEWRQRVMALPDPDDELVRYLPSRAPEGEESGVSQKKAMALCRRLVAVHCLYGVDKNPLAVELAKLALWLESHAEGFPLTFLDHRLVVGDSLTGPFWNRLITKPSKAKETEVLEDLYTQGLGSKFVLGLTRALKTVRDLEATVGVSQAEIEAKRSLKRQLDEALLPFRVLAAAWAGGVMLGPDRCDDHAYGQLVKTVCQTGALPERIESDGLRQMLARGLGVEAVPPARAELETLIASGACVPALAYDLTFPEVLYPDGVPDKVTGFDAILGNPPWDKIRLETRELLAAFSPEHLVGKERARTARDADLVRQAARRYSEIARQGEYVQGVKAMIPVMCSLAHGYESVSHGDPDSYQLFTLTSSSRIRKEGYIGFVMSAGLAKNPADEVARRVISSRMFWVYALHFLNRRRLFADLPPVIEFALHVWSGASPSQSRVAFDVDSAEAIGQTPIRIGQGWAPADLRNWILIRGFVPHPTEKEGASDTSPRTLDSLLRDWRIGLTTDLHRTAAEGALLEVTSLNASCDDARVPNEKRRLLASGYAPAYSGKSIGQFDDIPVERRGRWDPRVDLVACLKHSVCCRLTQRILYYRAAVRATCGSPKTNERSVTACVLTPGCTATNSVLVESGPQGRPDSAALSLVALLNSYTVDSNARLRIIANFNAGIVRHISICRVSTQVALFLAHECLRLVSRGARFATLWSGQVGGEWRENEDRSAWQCLVDDAARWDVRAAIDAVVAEAYGLTRPQYEHVLSTFSHKSYPKAPALCLAKFDELKSIGLEAFTKKHDPYWDIPLNENLPQPDPDVSAAIEKALAAARPASGKSDAPKDLFGRPILTDLFGREVKPKGGRKTR